MVFVILMAEPAKAAVCRVQSAGRQTGTDSWATQEAALNSLLRTIEGAVDQGAQLSRYLLVLVKLSSAGAR